MTALTLQNLVRELEAALLAADVSYGHGTSCALDEAAWLALHALGLPLDTDLDGPEGRQAISAEAATPVRALLQQRIQSRKPLAYLIRQA